MRECVFALPTLAALDKSLLCCRFGDGGGGREAR